MSYKYKNELDWAINGCSDKGSFDQTIMLAFLKADEHNLSFLKDAFPEHYKTWFAWKRFGLDLTEEDLVI